MRDWAQRRPSPAGTPATCRVPGERAQPRSALGSGGLASPGQGTTDPSRTTGRAARGSWRAGLRLSRVASGPRGVGAGLQHPRDSVLSLRGLNPKSREGHGQVTAGAGLPHLPTNPGSQRQLIN